MQKVIIKLNKDIRKQIAVNFINDRFSEELKKLNDQANVISKRVLENIYLQFPKEELDSFFEGCEKLNIETEVNNRLHSGEIVRKFSGKESYQRETLLPFAFFEKNDIVYAYNDKYCSFENNQKDNNKISYVNLLRKEIRINQDVYRFLQDFKELQDNAFTLESKTYELLAKVRTVDLLLKHWSEAHKYLPEDIDVEAPQELSLSEKFALL